MELDKENILQGAVEKIRTARSTVIFYAFDRAMLGSNYSGS